MKINFIFSFPTAEWSDGADRDQPPQESEPRERCGQAVGLLREFGFFHHRHGATRGRQGSVRLHHGEDVPGRETVPCLFPPGCRVHHGMSQVRCHTQGHQRRKHSRRP